jgi:hypothetical protein
VAFKLFQYRNKFYLYLQNIIKDDRKEDKAEKESCIESIFRLTNALGSLLLGLGCFEEAKLVYKSNNNAQLVFQIF